MTEDCKSILIKNTARIFFLAVTTVTIFLSNRMVHLHVVRRSDVSPTRFHHRSLAERTGYVQDRPIRVNPRITVVGTIFEAAANSDPLRTSVPEDTEPGDLLLLFVAGSGKKKRPGKPSGRKWKKIMESGENDLNLCTYYKWYDGKDDDSSDFKIEGGKSTFATLTTLRGVDKDHPIVDFAAQVDSMSGRKGSALAPSVFGVENGAVIGAFVYDDPHVVEVANPTFEMLVASQAEKKDGMAAAVASTDATGYVGTIRADGKKEDGAGDDIAFSISFQSEGGVDDETTEPTSAPSEAASLLGDTDIVFNVVGNNNTQSMQTADPTTLTSVTTSPTDEPTREPTLEPTHDPSRAPFQDYTLAPGHDYTTAPTVKDCEDSFETSGAQCMYMYISSATVTVLVFILFALENVDMLIY
mmetsp:Transcript_37528/g.81765  ORF Transcript_37528/g.81765 Transcript_37528/m.81765 type:complete len:413 (-) Transcript_37528:84-1322(-)